MLLIKWWAGISSMGRSGEKISLLISSQHYMSASLPMSEKTHRRAFASPYTRVVSLPQSVVVWIGIPAYTISKDRRENLGRYLPPSSSISERYKYAMTTFKQLFGTTQRP